MNSSAFKANVHLNIISFTSLSSCIFVIGGDKNKQTNSVTERQRRSQSQKCIS